MTIHRKRGAAGFTLIELLVVVLIIGILAAIAVPQYFKVVEHGKAAEAVNWIGEVSEAQERYLAKTGSYSTQITLFDAILNTVFNNYLPASTFATGVDAANSPTWGVSITRAGTPAVYSNYEIEYNAPPGIFSCNSVAASNSGAAPCGSDLLPQ